MSDRSSLDETGASDQLTRLTSSPQPAIPAPEHLTAVLAGMSEAVAIVDSHWRIRYVNRAGADSLGRLGEGLLGQTLWALAPDAVGMPLEAELRHAAAQRQPVRLEYPCQMRGRWFEMRVEPSGDDLLLFWQEISEQKRLMQALDQSDTWFRQIIDGMVMAVYVTDMDGRILRYNREAAALWGREPKLGHLAERYCGSLRIYTPQGEFLPHDQCPMAQVLRTGKAIRNAEIAIDRPDGSRFTALANPSPVRDEQGRMIGAVNCLIDIAERKRVEEALRRSEEQRRVGLEAAQMGTWDYDLATKQLHWDQRTAGLFDFHGRASVPLSEAMTRLHEDDQPEVARQIEAATAPDAEGRYDIEYRVVSRDGQVRWVRAVGQTLFQGHGDQRRAVRFVGVVFDTTETRAARRALEAANKRAEGSLAQLEAVVGQMTEGLLIADPQGHVLSMNPAAMAIHELASAEQARQHLSLYPETFEVFEIESGKPVPTDQWPLARALRGETFMGYEARVRNKRTGRAWIGSYGGTPVRDAEGRMQLAIVTLRDITERKQAEWQLQELNQTLEQRVAERTAEAEHRASQLQLMAAELTSAEQRERRRLAHLLHDDLQQLLVAAKMRLATVAGPGQAITDAGDLIKQAIDASRSLSTELAPPVLYDLGLAEALAWLGRWTRDKYGLSVEVHRGGVNESERESEQVRVLLFEAVRELLLNVVKHAGADEAHVILERENGNLSVRVEDAGHGFDAQGAQGKGGGSGFGLFSMNERLKLMGGTVAIDSAPGQGTRVRITVPVGRHNATPPRPATAQPMQAPPAPEAPAADAPLASPGTGRVRVLLADDHEILRRGLANLMAQQPEIEVVGEASTGEEALAMARRLHPDVVVMDISLPGISGIEATRRIAQEIPGCRVIGLSMHEAQDVAAALRSAGAAAFFSKSQPSEELVQAVQRLAPRG